MSDKFMGIGDVKKGKRWSYFWDYYKYPVISAIVIILIIISIVKSVVFKPLPDTNIFIAAYEEPITTYLTDNIEKYLSETVPDLNEDGEVLVKLEPILLFENKSVEDIEQQVALTNKFTAILSVGTYIIEIADEGAYQFLKQENLVADFETLEKYGYENPNNYTGDVKIPLSETKLDNVEGIDIVSDRLYMTLRFRQPGKSEEDYAKQVKLFISLLK